MVGCIEELEGGVGGCSLSRWTGVRAFQTDGDASGEEARVDETEYFGSNDEHKSAAGVGWVCDSMDNTEHCSGNMQAVFSTARRKALLQWILQRSSEVMPKDKYVNLERTGSLLSSQNTSTCVKFTTKINRSGRREARSPLDAFSCSTTIAVHVFYPLRTTTSVDRNIDPTSSWHTNMLGSFTCFPKLPSELCRPVW